MVVCLYRESCDYILCVWVCACVYIVVIIFLQFNLNFIFATSEIEKLKLVTSQKHLFPPL